jgi:surface polysaccharide O-acyltransferase-like enzyme
MTTAANTQERSASLDLVKVVACFLVILVHVTGVNLIEINSPGWAVTNVYESFGRVCVPMFFMASGATLLSRDFALGDFLRRRFLRILPPLIFWSAVYVAYYHLRKGSDAWTRLSMIPTKPAATHLWYLYALIGIYPFVPFFAKIFRNSDKSEKIYFIVLWFIFSTVMPFLASAYQIKPNLSVYYLVSISGFIGYFFLGAFCAEIARGGNQILHWMALATFIFAGLAIAYLTHSASFAAGRWVVVYQMYLTPLVAIASFGLFNSIDM